MGTQYVRVDVEARKQFPRLTYTRVSPDLVEDDAPEGYRQPKMVREYRLREGIWHADEYDITKPDAPRFVEWKRDGERWVPLRTLEGDAYPKGLRRSDGAPVIPYVLYHARGPRHGLHDPYIHDSLLSGSLDVAVLYAMVNHVFRDASWPQRYMLGANALGAGATDGEEAGDTGPRHEVVTDPSVILLLERMRDLPDGMQPQIGQFEASGDPKVLYEVLDRIAAQLAVDAGLNPADLQRSAPQPLGRGHRAQQ